MEDIYIFLAGVVVCVTPMLVALYAMIRALFGLSCDNIELEFQIADYIGNTSKEEAENAKSRLIVVNKTISGLSISDYGYPIGVIQCRCHHCHPYRG